MNTLQALTPRLLAGVGLIALLGAVGLVSSRPAHTAGGPVPVTVANSPLNVQNHDADNAARQPFQASTQYVIPAGKYLGALDTANNYADIVIPSGKRLVVQTVSEYIVQSSTGQVYKTFILPLSDGIRSAYALPGVIPDGTSLPGVTQSMTLYAEPGSTLLWDVFRNNTSGKSFIQVIVCGYLVDVP
jgi:hypothetical protein